MKRKHIFYVLILAVLFSAVTVVGVVYAKYVADIKGQADISVDPALLTATVSESFSDEIFTYTVTNDSSSSMPCFIRFALVLNWCDENGDLWATPVKGTDYYLDYDTDKIYKIGDYYYVRSSVAIGESFNFQIEQKTRIGDDSYFLKVNVLAEAIQTVPESVVNSAWDVTYTDGILQ